MNNKMIVEFLSSNNAKLRVDRQLYSENVVHKCLYWWGNKLSIDVENDHDSFIISLIDLSENLDLKSVILDIKRDLIDFKTREIITSETKDIKAILIAKAFANDDIFDEGPTGAIRDPAGFDPLVY
jgi:His-Xaa-Ser system protein HxsD